MPIDYEHLSLRDVDFVLRSLRPPAENGESAYLAIRAHLNKVRTAVAQHGPLDRKGIVGRVGDLTLPEMDLDGWHELSQRLVALSLQARRLNLHGASYWLACLVQVIGAETAFVQGVGKRPAGW